MKLIYTHDWDTDKNAVIFISEQDAKIYRTGIKDYSRRAYAIRYLRSIMEETAKLPAEPDEIMKIEENETPAKFENRVARDVEHVAEFERIFPKDLAKALETPKTFYKSHNVFPPSDIWYENEKAAIRENDGMDTIYLGPVEVYDPEEIERIEAEIASYPKY